MYAQQDVCSCCFWDQGQKGMKCIPTPAISAFLAFFSPRLAFWLSPSAEVSLHPPGEVEEGTSLLALWVRKVVMGWGKNKWLLSLLRVSQLGNGRWEEKATLQTTRPLTIFFVQEELCMLMEKWILEHTSSLHTAHNSFVSQPDQQPSVFYHVRVTHKSCEILSITCKICKIHYEFESP